MTFIHNLFFATRIFYLQKWHAKIFVIYLALLSSECVRLIANNPAKNQQHTGVLYGYKTLSSWFHLIEDSLIIMQWLRKSSHKQKDLYSKSWYTKWVKDNNNNSIPNECDNLMSSSSPAQKSIKAYLRNYKDLVKRKGNGTKLGMQFFGTLRVLNIT